MREEGWKLIEHYETGKRELFSLKEDIGETKNRAEDEPERLARMTKKLREWRQAVGADLMKPNPQVGRGE